MPRINILDESTINKIAAGEVIERPSSIVKELVENSIDAGSTQINIEIEDGGKRLIKITDNGCGIASDDINKAFLRHATSKIKDASDLDSILSLGFRGEALASIAAVSKIDLISKVEDSITGTHLIMEGGKILSKEPIGAKDGTIMSVEDLFFNTPARKKFLKGNQSETHAITDIISKLAVGNPSIKFRYKNNGKNMLQTLGDGDLLNAIRIVYGRDVASNLIKINYKNEYFEIDGYLANNNVYRSNRSLQHIYINGRYVKSSNIMTIINDSYKAIIPINKFPVFFLNLRVSPASVDINIHPNKLEVKFENEAVILSELSDFVRGALLKSSLVGRYKPGGSMFSTDKYSTFSNPTYTERQILENERELDDIRSYSANQDKNEGWLSPIRNDNRENNYEDGLDIKENHGSGLNIEDQDGRSHSADIEAKNDFKYVTNNTVDRVREGNVENIYRSTKADFGFLHDLEPIKKDETIDSERIFNAPSSILSEFIEVGEAHSIGDESKYSHLLGAYGNNDATEEGINENIVVDDSINNHQYRFKDEIEYDLNNNFRKRNEDFIGLRYVGIIFDTYVIFQKGNEMVMIDQHAAHERVRFEMYMKKFKNRDLTMQRLLEPIVMELGINDMDIALSNMDKFEKFGFCVEEFGPNHIRITDVPNIFGYPESERFIINIIDNIDKLTSVYDEKYDDIAEIACKSSIKANDKISAEEAIHLVNELEKCDNPYTCPHGRPIIVSMKKYDVEKMFKRVL